MKAIRHHIYGIKATAETLLQGKLLAFFIPGIVVGLWYFWAYVYTEDLNQSAKTLKSVWFVGDYLHSGASWIIDMLQAFLFEVFKFVVLTFLSPFNSILSEKFDTELTGRKFETSFIRILNDVLRAIFVVILALTLEFLFMGLWWILSLILPFSGILDPIMYFLISSFFFGFAFFDYSLERHGIGTGSSLGFAFSNMGHMILTGAIFTLLFKIPIAGIILAPVIATMVSTGAYIKMKSQPVPPPETL